MAEPIAELSAAITADDKTAKGVKSAENRLGKLGKNVSDRNKAIGRETERALGRSSKSVLGMMGRVEQGVSRALGSKSLTSGLAGRLGAVGEAGSSMAGGLAEAAASGGVLSGVAMGVTATVGATVAALAAGAYAAFKLSDSWAKGAAGLSRTAEIIGVSTKALTEFNAAAERAGVDKDTSTGALGSLSQTLNDARYGKNTAALEVMRRLGIGMKTNTDGTVNTEAMLPAIGDAIARQNSSGRRTAAQALGIPLNALPAFSQGGKALSADMKDADKTAFVLDDRAGNLARRAALRGPLGVLNDQKLERDANDGKQRLAGLMDGTVNNVVHRAVSDFDSAVHGDFKPATRDFSLAVDRFGGTVAGSIHAGSVALSGAGGHMASQVSKFFQQKGWSAAQAAGIAANLMVESGFNPKAIGDSGLAFGIAQWHPDRQADFRKAFGHDIHKSTLVEQLEFVNWELAHKRKGAGDRLRDALSSHDSGSIVSRFFEGPRATEYEASRRGTMAEAIQALPVMVEVTVNQHGKVIGTKVTAGHSKNPAISHAMVH